MPKDSPSAALIEISCPEPLYPSLRKIENLSVLDRPLRKDGGTFVISALAKPDAGGGFVGLGRNLIENEQKCRENELF